MTEPSSPPECTESAARAAHCWFDVDRVPRDQATTAWKRRARWGQARWRHAWGYPVGSHPYAGGADATPVGSRLELAFARASTANFVTPGALAAVRARLAAPEQYQMLKEDRLWADLLSSMPMCFNLFGDLASDGEGAQRAVRIWWPDAPTGRPNVRFEHSPGRRDLAFLGNRSAFDVAFEIDASHGGPAMIGVDPRRLRRQRRHRQRVSALARARGVALDRGPPKEPAERSCLRACAALSRSSNRAGQPRTSHDIDKDEPSATCLREPTLSGRKEIRSKKALAGAVSHPAGALSD